MFPENKMTSGFFHSRSERNAYVFMAILFVLLLMPPMRRLFTDIGLRWLYIFAVAMALSYTLTPMVRWFANRAGIVDTPDARKIHDHATPLLGGAAVFIAFAVSIIANDIYSDKLEVILTASLALFVAGVLDDSREIPAWIKLVVQICCSVWVIGNGIVLSVLPTDLGMLSEAANMVLTLLWIVGITNAMNFFDGMDGLASGLGTLIAFFLGVVAFQTHQPFLGWVAVAVMGSCLGFMPYNLRVNGKATIFLGDGGSTVIGFILACVAVYGDWAEHNPIGALVSPLLILWILTFDMVHITLDRIITGKVRTFREWIDYVGQDHLHHRLSHALGGPKRSVMFIFFLSFCLGTSAVVLRDARPIDAMLLLLQATILVVLITILERRGRAISAAAVQDRMEDTSINERIPELGVPSGVDTQPDKKITPPDAAPYGGGFSKRSGGDPMAGLRIPNHGRRGRNRTIYQQFNPNIL